MHFIIGLGALIGLITLVFGTNAAIVFARVVLILAGSGTAFIAYMIVTRVLQ